MSIRLGIARYSCCRSECVGGGTQGRAGLGWAGQVDDLRHCLLATGTLSRAGSLLRYTCILTCRVGRTF